ncbi:hypothetical protein [Brachyspira hyodysenteriae]|uniref:hypothetical protein n=1 Tax=Brachyspira hyodysenteriae TaxID=159 RepID=UPI0015C46774|nr:hypothetical protein [Brachyspira hyodysenteriae]
MLNKCLYSFIKSFSNIKYTVLASMIEIKLIIRRRAYLNTTALLKTIFVINIYKINDITKPIKENIVLFFISFL